MHRTSLGRTAQPRRTRQSLKRRRIGIQAGEKRPREQVLWTRQGPADEAVLLRPARGRVGDRTAVSVGGELWTANLASKIIGLPIALIASSHWDHLHFLCSRDENYFVSLHPLASHSHIFDLLSLICVLPDHVRVEGKWTPEDPVCNYTVGVEPLGRGDIGRGEHPDAHRKATPNTR